MESKKFLLEMPLGMYQDTKAKAKKLKLPVNKMIRILVANGLEKSVTEIKKSFN